jgi:hypothetical protein
MEAGKEASIHQDKANNYKEFQDVFQVKQVFQARVSSKYFKQVFQARVSSKCFKQVFQTSVFQVRQVNMFQASEILRSRV